MWRILRIRPVITGIVVLLLGLAMAGGGGWLVALGGTPYYLVAGLLLLGSGALLIAGWRAGAWLYAIFLILTVAWAVSEVGLDGWALMPRIVAPAVLGIWIAMPWVTGKLGRRPVSADAEGRPIGRSLSPWRGLPWAGACVVLIALVFGAGWYITASRYRQLTPVADITPPAAQPQGADNDWRFYGGTPAGDRYSPASQITPANVADLKPAWTLRTGDLPVGDENSDGHEYNFEDTPAKVGNTLYICTPHRHVIALDATTGAKKWEYDPQNDTSANVYLACRGVSYYDAPPGTADCPHRIFTTTADAQEHLIALDADTGKLCQSFGDGGTVSLTDGIGSTLPGFHFITSPPLVINDRLILGGWIYDNQSEGEPSGVIRAYDPVTGKLAWAWDMGRQPDPTAPLKPGETWTPGTSNGWGVYTADPALNMVYIPLGNPTPDYYGGYRRPFDDEYNSTTVALDITTGQERWHFQTVHHDLWDFDLPIGPSLVDLPGPDGQTIPALVQTTKSGQLFLLDRRNGHPLAQVQEEHVARGDIPGERYSPTQPFSTGMPALTPESLHEKDVWGITPIDQLACRIQFRRLRYDGLFTPPSAGAGNIGYPAFDGVVDWYGASIDPVHKLLIANSSYIPFTYQMIPHGQAVKQGLIKDWKGWGTPYPKSADFNVNPQHGTPFAVIIKPWLNFLNVPCNRPPWGMLTAIDLTSHKIAWQRPLGTTEDAEGPGIRIPFGLPTGIFNMGGNVITASGLIFVAATADQHIRAFDERTGKMLWEARLPAGGQATPMTYIGADGRQYLVIAAGGHGGLETRSGDYLMAFALPQSGH